jgi:hypothetical protein
MPYESLCLAQFPLEMVELGCDKCDPRRRLLKAKLIDAYGSVIVLPTCARSLLAAIGQPEAATRAEPFTWP